MNTASRSYYKRFYRLAAVATVVMTAVLTGSFVLGDSVRGSLVERVNERLGNTETIIQTGSGFLNDSILNHDLLREAHGYLMSEGFISFEGRMIPVTVWGTDNDSLAIGETKINQTLEKEIGSGTFVLHLPSNSLVASGSLFVSQSYANQMRLSFKGLKGGDEGGNILLHNEHVRPRNVFVNRQELAEVLGTDGKVNLILTPLHLTENDLQTIWSPLYSGVEMRDSIVGSDRVFMPQSLVEKLQPTARYLAYFVNSLGDIPYSFVTATDQLHGDETILSDYAARRMNAHIGDSITMEYYVSHGKLKQLETRSHRFIVSKIIPISQFVERTKILTAAFPGLSGIDHCTDWDSDLPIDMSRIKPIDEEYWSNYRQTPKALVSLDAVGNDWRTPYGVATRVVSTAEHLSHLSPDDLGIAVIHPKEDAFRAAQNGTDFGLLFLALGFFIIIAAILLIQNPLSEMYLQRQHEIHLFRVLGFSDRQLFRRLFTEALPVILLASPVGILLGYAYALLILWLLAGPWSGATHTDGFALHIKITTVVVACVVCYAIAITVLCLAIRSALKGSQQRRGMKGIPVSHSTSLSAQHLLSFLRYYRRQHRLSFWTLALGVLIVFAVGLNRPDFSHSSEKATGGYQFYGECRIPIQYDLNTTAGRHHLHLDNIPADHHFLQLPKHTEDEASCLNLNKVETPSVIGMSLEEMSSFGIDTSAMKGDTLIPVAIDEEALLWSMKQKIGDTLIYHTSEGDIVKAIIATSYPTGIFHGNAIMPYTHYGRLWPDETGSRILLGNYSQMATPLSDYGLTIMPATDRLKLFFEVTHTYLSIFLSLGGLGLLLGLASLLIVIRKNLTARKDEIRLYQSLGFSTDTIVSMLRREQMLVPFLAILTGALMSLISVIYINIHGAGSTTWITAIILFLLILFFTWIIIYISINSKVIKQCEIY